jgi:WD40 repeat protein
LWDVKAANYRTLEEVDDFGAFFPVFSPDGKTMVTAGHNSVLYLWDVGTGKRVRQLKGKRARYGSIGFAFSPDGKSVAFPAHDEDGYSHGLKRIDVATGREEWSVPISDKNALADDNRFSRDYKTWNEQNVNCRRQPPRRRRGSSELMLMDAESNRTDPSAKTALAPPG